MLAAEPLAAAIEREHLPGESARADEELVAHLRAESQTLDHPVGTCRFGRSDGDGAVVDPTLRVRGLDGLRGVDASVIPALRGHTSWPTVMVASAPPS